MTIAQNLAAVRSRIARACESAHRSADEVTLVLVSKMQPSSMIEEAYRHGQRDFGENYAKELEEKASALAHLTDLRWHFLGHLQTNKARAVAAHAACLQSVDRPELVDALESRIHSLRRAPLPVLVQVNVGRESQKSGSAPDDAAALCDRIERSNALALRGLMTVPPVGSSDTERAFATLARLRTELGGARRLPVLSMGMSDDFECAIAHGATMVRVGTAVFGARST